ncbi:hypothetical protein DSM104443_03193 [Usitatibacter rugosus]|uniref:Patatin-like phospholipase n=1 Tax=Usitatibacter rugosus TaxID=2732067 RepID=A0A6M4GXX1_9PROT|nr:hypothetical protein [Usitatibacter rugosus]QJR12109.1 hypothetical protein DSM104443_03193 [Usitatibacter rugosus]
MIDTRAEEISPEAAYRQESSRIDSRRSTLGLNHPAGTGKRWALALSGGGIRSATFALGVLQGLVAAKPAATATATSKDRKPILWYFDYLSTVSGGGYIGSFLCSLFVPGRLLPNSTSKSAAEDAYEVFTNDPPGRIRHNAETGSTVEKPLAWLRDNGRYLAPDGAGDMFYAAALALRNWVSLHFVIGTLLVAAFSFIALVRALAAWQFPDVAIFEVLALDRSLACPCEEVSACPCGTTKSTFEWTRLIWWSSLFAIPAAHFILATVPVGVSYWLCHPSRGQSLGTRTHVFTLATVGAVLVAVVLGLLAYGEYKLNAPRPAIALAVVGVIVAIAVGVHAFTAFRKDNTVALHRLRLTRLFSICLGWSLVLLFLAVADTTGQTVYRLIEGSPGGYSLLTLPVLVSGIVWIVRKCAKFFDQKDKGAKTWLDKVPVDLIAGAAGVVMLLAVMLAWQLLVQWLMWRGGPPGREFVGSPHHVLVLATVTATAVFLAYLTGLFPGFINLSSLQQLYGSRLTRAYLGGSNGQRFQGGSEKGRLLTSASEPQREDELRHEQYYAPEVAAPLHIINTTMNVTSDPGEQLVQRDRKGQPLAVLPHGYSIDGTHYTFAQVARPFENQQPLKIGQWIGTSGAAFTTGLGRSTSLGTSLALGLANVRLGTWWESGAGENKARSVGWVGHALFKSQTYLAYELLAMFHGLARKWQYLSDGGHFENTGLYELLRPERKVCLAIVSDNGCDPLYQFGDLANLARLVRIDHRIELTARSDFPAPLSHVFAHPRDFRKKSTDDPAGPRQCAVLLEARPVSSSGVVGAVSTVVILLKPRPISDAPVDVQEYHATHELFPQEPTADQFFDEAQWESYRKLGQTIASRVFGPVQPGTKPEDDVPAALWELLEREYQIQR